ncbi:hypothetical protein GcM3_185047b [Golovinomyces cichoracearum]|uniref:RdRp catalytic domain-containing protein n=1 Tax=Golovinomyces cichoracearum TaxID=62708 RepID=A0A420HKK3_9PEZI|nr:hypothetical protein GcM3_185047b [Golovinomyces cichoracearum]
MFKTRLSHIVENVFGLDTAYTRMIKKVKEKEISIGKSSESPSTDEFIALVESVIDICCVAELFVCIESCGHPLIDTQRCGLSASEEARTPDQTLLQDAHELRAVFCHTISTSHIKMHGVWPKLIHSKKDKKLRILNERQERNLTYTSYPFSDWDHVQWTKFLDFNFFPKFLELMDDKSISFYKSDKHTTWTPSHKPQSQR